MGIRCCGVRAEVTAAFKAEVAALVGPKVFGKSAMNIRDGAGVFDRVLGGGRYRRVLEIGTYKGVSTAYLARLCERVITLDLLHGKLEHNGESFDRAEFWRRMGVADRIELHLLAQPGDKAALIKGLAFDMAFIDGGKNDIADDFAMVKHCGAVLFHDYDYRAGPGVNAVYDFVNSLPKARVQIMDIFALWTT